MGGVCHLGTFAAVPWSVRLMIPGVAWSLSRWILFGVRGRGFVIKDSGTVAAVLSMIQAGTVAGSPAGNVCGGAVVDSVGRPKANYSLHTPPPLGCTPMGFKELLKGRPLYGVSRTP